MITEKGEQTTSYLLIQRAQPADSGKYTCHPSNANTKSVTVHVLNGAYIQPDGFQLFFSFPDLLCSAPISPFHPRHCFIRPNDKLRFDFSPFCPAFFFSSEREMLAHNGGDAGINRRRRRGRRRGGAVLCKSRIRFNDPRRVIYWRLGEREGAGAAVLILHLCDLNNWTSDRAERE